MVTQLNKPRQAGPALTAYIEKRVAEMFNAPAPKAAAESQALSEIQPTQHASTCAPERNLRDNAPLLRGSTEEGKKGSREMIVLPATQAGSNDSYKAQKSNLPQGPNALGIHQNPTNDPRVAILLDRHGDMRQVILESPIFATPCTLASEGGWGISVGAMINAGKQYTLARVLWAIDQAKAYRGANDRGKLFYHILRKGLEAKA